jgi:tetratricopeptide (TPR) repeat protein
MSVAQLHLVRTPSGWQARWTSNGREIEPPVSLKADAEWTLRGLAHRFLAMFEQGNRPYLDPAEMLGWGYMIFQHVFAPAWPAVQAALEAAPHSLVLKCSEPDLLNLPWELVELHPGLPVGCDAAWELLRVPDAVSTGGRTPPDPGPLRLLFLAAAPTDQPQLDFEREEDAMLQATARLNQSVIVLPFAETGGIDELAGLVAEHRPHVVHLSGHASVDAMGVGLFAFEDERGDTDPRPIDEIVSHVFRGSAVRCVVLNACQSAQAAVAGLAQKLVEAGIPLALGWAASVRDDRATKFVTEFYRFLARGDAVATAAARAREVIWRSGRQRKGDYELIDATFALPQLYGVGHAVELVDRAAAPRPYEGPRTVRTILEDGIKGLEKGFIGRRRIQQQLLPALRDGSVTFAVLHGLGGMGKSTLATRAANRLKEAGFTVYGVRTPKGIDPALSGRDTWLKLNDALVRAFEYAGRQDLNKLLTAYRLPLGQRLRLAVQGLCDLRVVFVLDNLEDALDVNTRQIVDPALREAYQILSRDLTAGSRVLVTARYLPAETPTDQPTVWHRDLTEMTEAVFYKFLRQDAAVSARMTNGELPLELLQGLYHSFGGTPDFLVKVKELLRSADPDELSKEPLDEELPLEVARQQHLERLYLPRLYAALPSAARQLVSRLAVSELPLPPEGLAGLLETDERNAVAAAEAGVNFGLVQSFPAEAVPTLYHPPGLVRLWLAGEERLGAGKRREVDGFLARFWRERYEQRRVHERRIPPDVGLLACRHHAREAGAIALIRWSTLLLVDGLEVRSEWKTARDLIADIAPSGPDSAYWHSLGRIDFHEGDYDEAREKLNRALENARVEGDGDAGKIILINLAYLEKAVGNYAEARRILGEAPEITQAIKQGDVDAEIVQASAVLDTREGNYPAARQKLEKYLALQQAARNLDGEGTALHNLGYVDLLEGKYADARGRFLKALGIKQITRNIRDQAVIWQNIGRVDLKEGNNLSAREHIQKGLGLSRLISDPVGEVTAMYNLTSVDKQEGKYEEALKKLSEALSLARSKGLRDEEASISFQLGSIELGQGNYAAARENLEQASKVRMAIGDRAGEASALHELALAHFNSGSPGTASEKLGEALRIRQSLGDRAVEADTWNHLGLVAWESQRQAGAVRLVAVSLVLLQRIGHEQTEIASGNFRKMCERLQYEERQQSDLISAAAEAYERDRGRRLLLEVFPELKDLFPA